MARKQETGNVIKIMECKKEIRELEVKGVLIKVYCGTYP
jgi:hypothetical protein